MVRDDGRRITPEMAVVLLNEDGIEVDVEQTMMILDFLYVMVEIAVDCYIDSKESF